MGQLEHRTVQQFMTTDIISLGPSAHIREVAAIFTTRVISGIPIVDDKGKLLGEITKKDLVDAILPNYLSYMENLDFIEDFGHLESEILEDFDNPLFIAADIMNSHPVVVGKECTLLKSAAVMNKNNVEVLLVTEGEMLVGVFSLTDLCKALFA